MSSGTDGVDAAAETTRSRRLIWLAATFVVLFVVCLLLVLPNGRATPLDYGRIPANARIEQVLPPLGFEDAYHYLRAGYDIAQDRAIPPETRPQFVLLDDTFVLNFWPPGMALSFAALFTIFGADMPVGLVVAGVTALLWGALLTAFVDLLTRTLHVAVAVTMVGLVLLTDIVQDWILGIGVFWSEGMFTWCILGSLYAAARLATARSERARRGWAAATGGFLGLSAYFRTVSDLLGWMMVAVLVAWGALVLIRRALRRHRARRNGADAPGPSRWNSQLVALLLCVLAFQAVTMPWRIFAAQQLRPGNYAWSTEANGLWHDSWTPDRVLLERKHTWILAGRPNTACQVDNSTCREIARYELRQPKPYSGAGRYSESDYRRLVIRAFVRHPVAYTADRLTYLRRAWFWGPIGRVTEWPQNALLAAAVIGALALSVRRFWRSGPDLLALLFPGVAFASLIPFTFFHFEARYFFTLKLVGLVAAFVLLAADPPARLRRRA